MPGVIAVESATNVGSAVLGWSNFLQTLANYQQGNASQGDLVLAATGFVASANQALTSSELGAALGTITGFGTSLAALTSDIQAYNAASDQDPPDTVTQNKAVASLVSDASGVGGGIASAVGAYASYVGDSGLVEIAANLNAASVAIAAVATVAGTAYSAANWLTNYLNALGNALLNGAVQQSIEMWQLDISGDSGNVELMMAGQSGDSFTQTPLGGSGFQYTESGTQPGSVQLAENGASDVEYASGTDIVTDITGFQVVLNTANNIEIDGSKNLITVQGGSSTATISGEENSVQVQSSASGSTLTFNGAGVATNTLDLQSASALSVHLGDAAATGLTITSEGNSSVSVDAVATGASISATTTGNLALTATGMTLNLLAGQFQLSGSGDAVSLSASASVSLGATDTNNQITNTVSGQLITVSGGSVSVSGSSDIISSGASDSITVNQDGSQIIEVFDSTGAIVESDRVNSDGTSFNQYYSSTGALIEKLYNLADGSSDVYLYSGFPGLGSAYTEQAAAFSGPNKTGSVEEAILYFDTSAVNMSAIKLTFPSGVEHEWIYDPDNTVYGPYIFLPDGTQDNSQAATSTWSTLPTIASDLGTDGAEEAAAGSQPSQTTSFKRLAVQPASNEQMALPASLATQTAAYHSGSFEYDATGMAWNEHVQALGTREGGATRFFDYPKKGLELNGSVPGSLSSISSAETQSLDHHAAQLISSMASFHASSVSTAGLDTHDYESARFGSEYSLARHAA